MDNKRVTIRDVARESKCSIATVSRVINGTNLYYSLETKEKVEAAVKRLHYMPNLNAKGLKEQRTFNIAFLTPQIDDYYVGIFDAMQEEANRKGYTVVILSSNYSRKQEQANINHIREKQYDGVVIATGLLIQSYNQNLAQVFGETPVVLLEGVGTPDTVHTVRVDVEKVCREATEYLIQLGHTRIAYVSAPCRFKTLTYRFRGYLAALEANGIPLSRDLIFFEQSLERTSFNKCYQLMKHIISSNQFTAMFVMSDWAAFSTLKIAAELGLRVPEDLSVIGFDDLPFTEFSEPQLSTISQNSRLIGEKGIGMLFDMLNKEIPENITVDGRLMVRGSVAKKRKNG